MSVERIIEESINKNPLGLKEAFIETLKQRVDEAIQSKIDEASEEITEAGLAITHGKPTSVSKQHSNSMRATVSSGNLKPKQKPLSTKSSGSLKPIKHESVELEEGKYVERALAQINSRLGTSYKSAKEMPDTHKNAVYALAKQHNKNDIEKMKKEEVEQIDEISKSTLGSYATKALRRGDIAARMSHTDSDDMGKIANKRLTGAKKAVEKIAPKAAATKIKTNIDKAREAAKNRYTDKDDQGKAYYAAQKGISKVREEVELSEADHDDAVKSFLARGGKVTKVPEGERDPKLSATFKRTKMAGADKAKLADPNKEKVKDSKYRPSLIAQAHQDWKMKKESAGEDNQE